MSTISSFWAKKWPLIAAAVLATSGFWGFFHYKIVELKNEQIDLLTSERDRLEKSGPNPEAVATLARSFDDLRRRLIPLSIGFPADKLTGQIGIGNAATTTTELTKAMSDAQSLIKARKFDQAESRIRDAEIIYPDFAGAIYLRFELEREKGNTKEAEVFADRLIALLPNDSRILSVFEYSIRAKLKKGEKRKAEELALAAIQLDPEKEVWREFFQESFGYLPALLTKEEIQTDHPVEPTARQ